jgi:hypothetical protein
LIPAVRTAGINPAARQKGKARRWVDAGSAHRRDQPGGSPSSQAIGSIFCWQSDQG